MEIIVNSMDWFEYTESLNSILNRLIAHYNVELMNLLKKEQTPEYREYCTNMLAEVSLLNRDTEIWQDLSLMKFYIEQYSPLTRKINELANNK